MSMNFTDAIVLVVEKVKAWVNENKQDKITGTAGQVVGFDADGKPVSQEAPPGVPGPQGPKGDTGEKGDKGDTGDKGADGKSVTHKWSGTTLSVTSASGTSSADLKGDKGDTGPQGAKGDKGDKGDKGYKGDKGDTGANGPQGPAGKTPVRGTDYWTATDKAEIVSDVLEQMPEGGGGGVSSWNDLTDKPVLLVGNDTLTWDGNTDGLDSFVSGSIGPFYKISEATPAMDEVVGGTYLIGERTVEITADDLLETNPEFLGAYLISLVVYIVPNDVTLNGEAIKKGTYFISSEKTGTVHALTVPGFTGFNAKEIIDPEHLPDSAKDTVRYVEQDLTDEQKTQARNNLGIPAVPTKVSQLENDAGYLKSFSESDPTVPAWAKQPNKPTYTADEVGAQPKLTGTAGQFVGFDANGNAVAQAAPSGGGSGGSAEGAVLYTAQTLTDAQKQQARTNIAAVSSAEAEETVMMMVGTGLYASQAGAVTWDGVIGNKPYVNLGDDVYLVRITEEVPTVIPDMPLVQVAMSQFVGEAGVTMGGAVPMESVADGFWMADETVIIVPSDNYDVDGIVFPKKGVYVIAMNGLAEGIDFSYMFISAVRIIGYSFAPTNTGTSGGEELYFGSAKVVDNVLTWDGNTAGMTFVAVPDGEGVGLVHVSSVIPDVTQVTGSIQLTDTPTDGEKTERDIPLSPDESIRFDDGCTLLADFCAAFIPYDNYVRTEFGDLVFPKKGIYFLSGGTNCYISALSIDGYTFPAESSGGAAQSGLATLYTDGTYLCSDSAATKPITKDELAALAETGTVRVKLEFPGAGTIYIYPVGLSISDVVGTFMFLDKDADGLTQTIWYTAEFAP